MGKYSIFSLLRNAMSFHEGWEKVWRSPDPKSEYDVIIVGGGGHGLATAYYLAKEHGITNVVCKSFARFPSIFGWCKHGARH